MKKTVLFYDSLSRNRKSAATTLAVTDCQTVIPKTEKDFMDALKKEKFNMLVYPIEYHEVVLRVSKQNLPTPTILLSQSKIRDLHQYFSKEHSTNILAKSKDGLLNSRELITTVRKIFNQDIFGVKHYVNYGTESEVYHIRDSEQRAEYIDTVREFCNRFHLRTSTIQSVELFCEELLMNAIYDAPRDSQGKELYGNISRKDRVILKPRDAARMEFACDGEKLVVSVSDPFGGITWEVVQRYLARCFSGNRKITNLGDEGGGAGLGLYFCFTAANSCIINVHPDKRSEFIGIFDLNSSAKERNRLYSSLHFFSTEQGSHSAKLLKPKEIAS